MGASRRLSPERKARLRLALRRPLTVREEALQAPIGRLRAVLAADTTPVAMQDFGAGTRAQVLGAEAKPTTRTIADIYQTAAASPTWGTVLFRLARALKPQRVLELGTNLGVSAGHLQAALCLNEFERTGVGKPSLLVSIEGDPTLADAARAHLHDLRATFGQTASTTAAVTTATVVTGRFDDALPGVLNGYGPFDLVFLDGHHEEAATRRYFARIAPHLAPGACVVFDDIEPGHAVRRAWSAICKRHPDADRVDLGKLGLLFVDSA